MSCDPAATVDGTNLYAYARNAPINFIDSSGTQSWLPQNDYKPPPLVVGSEEGQSVSSGKETMLRETDEQRMDDPYLPQQSNKPTYVSFIRHHTSIAIAIGKFVHGSTNISTIAIRFSTRIGLEENNSKEGTEVNAMRHALWQAIITRRFGENIAREAGYAHENPLPKDLTVRTFKGKDPLSEADTTIDLLNNVIGREIGSDNPNATNQQLAIKALDYFHTYGLFTATTNQDGSVTVSQTKITDEKYRKGLGILKDLGFADSRNKKSEEEYSPDG